ncbi:hypothetical protein [Schaalia hyovaginalis]|uniref:hypothetical protein n=1 Tax=Schaalia hyovaginalis TaxID=29316 RepID=UPI002A759F69|nr:hypothetical protein [Schaalia hyovaginalis]
MRHSALTAFADAQQGAVAACASVPTVEPELLEAGKALTDVSELESLAASASPVVAALPPKGLSALRAATAELTAKQKTCEDAASKITAAKADLEGKVKEDLRTKLEAEAAEALKTQEAGFQLDKDVAGKIDPDPSAPGTQLRTAMLSALGDLTGALPTGNAGASPWQVIADERAKLADAKAKAEAAMKAVSDAYAAWQEAAAEAASAPAASYSSGESSSSAGNGGNASYSSGYSASQVSQDYSSGSSNGSGVSSSTGESTGSQDLGSSGYWYNHNQPEYVYDSDGYQHHQIRPDENGSWTDSGSLF